MWDFDALGIREVRNAAASAARKADVIAVSVSAQQELPGTVRAWFDMWLWLLEDENPALVALFDSHATPKLVSIRDYLSCIAQRAGIESSGRDCAPKPWPRPNCSTVSTTCSKRLVIPSS